jgi:hypothetical protein
MAVAIRESRAETEERLPLSHLPDIASQRERFDNSDELIWKLESVRFAAKLAEFQRKKGTTLPAAEFLGTFPVPVPHVETRFQCDENELERAYDRLGLWAGPYSSRSGIKSELDFWRASGRQGVSWLIQRTRSESGNDTLNAVANVLSNLGTTALSTILGYLQAHPTPDQAYCLLDALGRMGRQSQDVADRVAVTIMRYIAQRDLDLRQAAVSATSALPPANALEILRSALVTETDPTITEIIREEIEERIRE